ncbi:MAG: hypothetical protein KGS09_06155 [Nitrospirae bacterium]|nr:hypothetical protein [Nitrospirota bacterium]
MSWDKIHEIEDIEKDKPETRSPHYAKSSIAFHVRRSLRADRHTSPQNLYAIYASWGFGRLPPGGTGNSTTTENTESRNVTSQLVRRSGTIMINHSPNHLQQDQKPDQRQAKMMCAREAKRKEPR